MKTFLVLMFLVDGQWRTHEIPMPDMGACRMVFADHFKAAPDDKWVKLYCESRGRLDMNNGTKNG